MVAHKVECLSTTCPDVLICDTSLLHTCVHRFVPRPIFPYPLWISLEHPLLILLTKWRASCWLWRGAQILEGSWCSDSTSSYPNSAPWPDSVMCFLVSRNLFFQLSPMAGAFFFHACVFKPPPSSTSSENKPFPLTWARRNLSMCSHGTLCPCTSPVHLILKPWCWLVPLAGGSPRKRAIYLWHARHTWTGFYYHHCQ